MIQWRTRPFKTDDFKPESKGQSYPDNLSSMDQMATNIIFHQGSTKWTIAHALILAFILLQPVSAQHTRYNFPAVDDLPVTEGLQNPFLKPDGSLVQTKEEWLEQREYLKAMLIQYQYGTIPPKPQKISVENVSSEEILGGRGILDLFNITISRNGHSVTLHCSLYRPNKPGKFPVVIKNDREIAQSDDVISKAIEMGYCISRREKGQANYQNS